MARDTTQNGYNVQLVAINSITMNILALHNNYPATTLSNIDTCVCYTLPETAVQKNGKPVFLPDYANPAALEVHLAIRICRLGRSISMRFAHRYYDAITALPHFFSVELLNAAKAQGQPWSVAMGFDNALPVGDFLPFTPGINPLPSFRLTVDGATRIEGDGTQMLSNIDEVIARLSRFYTFRRGDILLLGAPQAPISIDPDHRIETFVSEERVTAFNVK